MGQPRIVAIGDLPLQCGDTLPDARLACITYGRLAPDRRNVILLTHGYTSSHLFADGAQAAEGSWSGLVGPGLAIDTDRYFVISSNMLGSSFGSTAPRTLNPRTGRAWGPDFPAITVQDIVVAQKHLLETFAVDRLHAVVGPSYGGFQAFVWGITYPEMMRGLVPAVTGLKAPRQVDMDALEHRLSQDPNWNAGRYYETGGIVSTMTAVRAETLRGYGVEVELAERYPDKQSREAALQSIAREWAEAFDAHSLLTLGRAANAYDATPHTHRIKARVLYALSRTDALFPPSLANEVIPTLKAAGVDARYYEIDSPHGHLASGRDSALWAPALRSFLEDLG